MEMIDLEAYIKLDNYIKRRAYEVVFHYYKEGLTVSPEYTSSACIQKVERVGDLLIIIYSDRWLEESLLEIPIDVFLGSTNLLSYTDKIKEERTQKKQAEEKARLAKLEALQRQQWEYLNIKYGGSLNV